MPVSCLQSLMSVDVAAKVMGEMMAALRLSSFLDFANRWGLQGVLNGSTSGNYTLFVPSEEAFASENHSSSTYKKKTECSLMICITHLLAYLLYM